MRRLLIIILIVLSFVLVSADLSLSSQEYFELGQIPIHAFLEDSVNTVNANDTWVLQVAGVNLTGLHETICVLDSGIDFSHPDLFGKNVTCNIDCLDKSCIENCSVTDDFGHGTHVAGIVSANGSLKGVAPDANLIGVKVLDFNGGGNFADLYNAIQWCVSNAFIYNISVITMSLGTNSSIYGYSDYCDSEFSPLPTIINSAISNNISVIASNGNEGNKTHLSAPACIENVTAVSWTNGADNDVYVASNNNNLTDLLAPGTNINSTMLSINNIGPCPNGNLYCSLSGTSMSAPHVAGAFALMNQFLRLSDEGKTISERENIFISTGKFIVDSFAGDLWNKSRINIYAAIDYLWGVLVILNTPTNNSYVNHQVNFSCNSSLAIGDLENTTFYLWNSTDLVFNETKNITGETNFTEFNYTLNNSNYSWNCLTLDNKNRSSWGEENFTITFDNVTPVVNLSSPVENYSSSSSIVQFEFNFSDENIANCSLYVNDIFNSVNSSLTGSKGIISSSFSNGNYNWTINCTDLAGNLGTSNETRNFSVNYVAPVVPTSGGGGGGSSANSYSVDKNELELGYLKNIRKGDSLKFKIGEESHSLKVDKIGNNFTELIIQSEIQKIILFEGEEKKISFDNVTYELLVKLNKIPFGRVNLTIKQIDELILVEPKINESYLENLRNISIIAFENESQEENNKTLFQKGNQLIKKVLEYKFFNYFFIFVILILMIVFYWIFKFKEIIRKKKFII